MLKFKKFRNGKKNFPKFGRIVRTIKHMDPLEIKTKLKLKWP